MVREGLIIREVLIELFFRVDRCVFKQILTKYKFDLSNSQSICHLKYCGPITNFGISIHFCRVFSTLMRLIEIKTDTKE